MRGTRVSFPFGHCRGKPKLGVVGVPFLLSFSHDSGTEETDHWGRPLLEPYLIVVAHNVPTYAPSKGVSPDIYPSHALLHLPSVTSLGSVSRDSPSVLGIDLEHTIQRTKMEDTIKLTDEPEI
jgi:hypothetical protein